VLRRRTCKLRRFWLLVAGVTEIRVHDRAADDALALKHNPVRQPISSFNTIPREVMREVTWSRASRGLPGGDSCQTHSSMWN
jgi:hypothetical protein